MSEKFDQPPHRSDKNHWEGIYAHKSPDQLSWTQAVPQTSLDFIHSFKLSRTARILDVGGGDSRLVDYLLEEGFENIAVLDISEHALKRAKDRLGDKATRVKWIVSDINDFHPESRFDLWHDRATFHFLTTRTGMSTYLKTARESVKGFMILGTFSTDGPDKCSGLPIKQYSESTLSEELKSGFKKIKCKTETHITPFDTRQAFLFCSFRKRDA